MSGAPIAFRFGLTGRRWGDEGPVVLLVHGRDAAPRGFADLVAGLVAAGRHVIALDDPTESGAAEPARVTELAAAIVEAAVELRALESIVAHGRGAAAAAQALAQGLDAERAVLLARDLNCGAEVLDQLVERSKLPLAA